jgi:signal peptide peptidase-like protein 3
LFAALSSAMGMGLCVAFIAFVRLPSLKVSTLLLTGLLVYDVFWVFFSSYIFSSNVMVRVATRSAENPVGLLSKRLHMHHIVYPHRHAPKLSLPGKLVFPSMNNSGHFSMLGLGDIVMPGLLLCFVLRYDAYKRTMLTSAEAGVPPPNHFNKITYFHCSLIGYFFGKNPLLLSEQLVLLKVSTQSLTINELLPSYKLQDL